MACEIIDIQCILVNEIFGSVALAIIGGMIMYFLIAGRLKLGAELTLAVAFPVVLIFALAISGFQPIFAFATMIAALMIAFVFQRIIGNR